MNRVLISVTSAIMIAVQASASPTFAQSISCQPVKKPVIYVITKNDQLALVLHLLGLEPLYGAQGSVETTKKINQLKNVNIIYPGQKIRLPVKCQDELNGYSFTETPQYTLVQARTTDPTFSEGEPPQDEQSQTFKKNEGDTSMPISPDSFFNYSEIQIRGTYGFYQITSTEADDQSLADILSTPSLGLNLSWTLFWSERWASIFEFSYEKITFEDPQTGEILDPTKEVGSIHASMKYKVSPRITAQLGLGSHQRLFAQGFQSGGLMLNSFNQTSFNLSLRSHLIRRGALGLDGDLFLRSLLGTTTSTYSVDSSLEYGLGANIYHRLGTTRLSMELQYWSNEFESSIAKQSTKSLLVLFGLSKEFGK